MGVWLAAREPGRGTATRYAGIPTLLFFCVHIARALFYRKNPVFSMKPGNAEAISNKPARQEFPAAPALQPSRQPPSVTDGKKVYAVDNKDLLDRPKFKSANLTETIEEVFPLTVVPALSHASIARRRANVHRLFRRSQQEFHTGQSQGRALGQRRVAKLGYRPVSIFGGHEQVDSPAFGVGAH